MILYVTKYGITVYWVLLWIWHHIEDFSGELETRSHLYDRREFEPANESIRLVLSHLN
jgi:hypothetical protein